MNIIEQRLYDAMAGMDIVDGHDHLPLEREYIANGYAGIHFFAGYAWCDLWSAGLSPGFRHTMRNPGYRPVEEWWPKIKPYWDHIRHGTYAKPLLITARELFGIEEINDRTIHELDAKIRADNIPGLYTRIFEKCRIQAVLNNPDVTEVQDHPLCYLVPWVSLPSFKTWDGIAKFSEKVGMAIQSFDDLLTAYDKNLEQLRRAGAVAFKVGAHQVDEENQEAARAAFNTLQNSGHCSDNKPLLDYLFWKMLDKAAEFDVPIAIHSGMWGDFRTSDPKHVISWAAKRPNTRFDLFHLGAPFTRDSMIVAKNEPNVSLNLCWTYVISEQMMLHAVDELIDLVPLNKIIGFGADYVCSIHKTYGHLVLARQILARVFARRIQAGDFTEDHAGELLRRWLYDNPKAIYRINTGHRE